MIPRWLLGTYVLALPVLGVAFGVVMAAAALAGGLGDATGARGLFWVAMALLMLLATDLLLLVATLGLIALGQKSNERDEEGRDRTE